MLILLSTITFQYSFLSDKIVFSAVSWLCYEGSWLCSVTRISVVLWLSCVLLQNFRFSLVASTDCRSFVLIAVRAEREMLQKLINKYLLTPWSRVLLAKLTGSAASQEIPRILEPEGPSPYSQAPATCPYPKPTPSSLHNPLPLPEDAS